MTEVEVLKNAPIWAGVLYLVIKEILKTIDFKKKNGYIKEIKEKVNKIDEKMDSQGEDISGIKAVCTDRAKACGVIHERFEKRIDNTNKKIFILLKNGEIKKTRRKNGNKKDSDK